MLLAILLLLASPPQTTCLRPDGVRPKPNETITLAPRQWTTCFTTLNQPAPLGGLTITPYDVDSPLVLSPTRLVIPAGGTFVTFFVIRGTL